jgi:maltooligosyltrehalose trehalohydrolase
MSSPKVSEKTVRLGATRLPDGSWQFLLWAPKAHSVRLHLLRHNEFVPLEPLAGGYYCAIIGSLDAGCQYLYRLDDQRELPDPASRFQPQGVHGPSQLVDTHAFAWTDDNWRGHALEKSVFYELHVGTYTYDGSFDALIQHLPHLVDLGITTLELMPIAQFPGSRNWGYDGVYPFAPQNSYGSTESLQRLVNAAHGHGLSVALDVVYNHLGPEGNYLSAYAPYFTDRYRTPWGQAINFDGAGSDEVRRFFIENALDWLEDYHFDALRLDAVHGIFDLSARHFLAELKSSVDDLSTRLNRPLALIAESDLNDSRMVGNPTLGGYGLDAQWSDDFHHSLHTLLTRENRGYYADFPGIGPMASTLRNGWHYSGQYSEFRGRRHGNSAAGIPSSKFVVASQNHDQVGNRAAGERLTALVNFEALKLAAGMTLLSPFVPFLFMGEEYGETAPFQYFTSHSDPALVEAVRKGRREEFAAFGWADSVPDPQDDSTFERSRLDHSVTGKEPHRTLFRFYRELIRIRRDYALGEPVPRTVHELGDRALLLLRQIGPRQLALVCNFAEFPVDLNLSDLSGQWQRVIRSADATWNGPEPSAAPNIIISAATTLRLSSYSFLLMERTLPEAA